MNIRASATPAHGRTLQILQMQAGAFGASLDSEEAPPLVVHRHYVSNGFKLASLHRDGATLLGLSVLQTGWVSLAGRLWPAHEIVLCAGSTRLDLCGRGAAAFVWLELPNELGAALLLHASIQTHAFLTLPEREFAELSAMLAHPVGKRGPALLELLASALRRARRAPARRSAERRYGFITRAEAFMEANLDETIALDDVSRAAGCSARTLIYAFSSAYGVSPMAFLRVLRLNAVHRQLRGPTAAHSVADAAGAHGFWHMGHFSSDYKAFFGRSPSATLRASRAGQLLS